MAKVRKYEKKLFESTRASWDTSANIFESMLRSAAWKSLSGNQKALYVTCKSQYYDVKKHPNDDRMQFYMNQSLWLNKYELYTLANHASFYRDMKVLIDRGFIECAENGKSTRTKSVYRYNNRWPEWKPTDMVSFSNVDDISPSPENG